MGRSRLVLSAQGKGGTRGPPLSGLLALPSLPAPRVSPPSLPQGDAKMMEILKFTHQFLQKFCAGNQENQALLHKHLNLFLTPGVRRGH